MQPTLEEREHAKITRRALKEVFQILFGTVYIDQYFAVFMVGLSIVIAVLIPDYDGLFLTSQSRGMTNYHRWLYDIFVIVSSLMGFVLYFLLKRQKYNTEFGQKWRAYIRANAEVKLYRYQKAQQEGKFPLLHTRFGEYFFLIFLIILFVSMYSLITPIENSRSGNFFIQTWWPINAVIIGVLYSGWFWLYVRLFAVKAIMTQYRGLIRCEQAKRNRNNTIEKC